MTIQALVKLVHKGQLRQIGEQFEIHNDEWDGLKDLCQVIGETPKAKVDQRLSELRKENEQLLKEHSLTLDWRDAVLEAIGEGATAENAIESIHALKALASQKPTEPTEPTGPTEPTSKPKK